VAGVREKLFNKDYALLWLGMAVSQLGDGAGTIGLMWWVQTKTGSAMLLGTIAMVRTMVSVVLSPVGGALADRANKKLIIVGTDIARGLAYAMLAYLVYMDQLTTPVLLSLVAITSVCSALFNPAVGATVPLLVSKANLPRANSLQQITSNLVSIIGYSAGGVLVAFLGIPLLLAIDAVSFLLSAGSEMLIHIPRLMAKGKATAGRFVQDIKDGLLYVRQNRVLIDIMKVAAVLNFVGAPVFILLPKYVQEHLGGSPTLYGYMLAASMAGTLCASLLIAFTKTVERNMWLFLHGVTMQGALIASLALLSSKGLAVVPIALFMLMGLLNGIVNVYFASLVQRTTDPEQMGRVFGLLNTMCGGLQPISQGLTGYLGDVVPIPIIYAISGTLEGLGGVRLSTIPNLLDYLTNDKEQQKRSEPALSTTND
jgi:DHA3 family macrolide efflux protein-like MFS transporter